MKASATLFKLYYKCYVPTVRDMVMGENRDTNMEGWRDVCADVGGRYWQEFRSDSIIYYKQTI